MFGGGGGNVFASNKFGGSANTTASGSGVSQDVSNQIITTVKQDMDMWEKSGQWIFSCYSCSKDCPSVPGLLDYSPEELRHEAYQDVKAGSTNFQSKVSQLQQEYRNKRNQLSNPDNQLKQVLVKIYKKESIGDYVLGGNTSIFSGGSTQGGIFGGAAQNQGSMFGGTSTSSSSAFGGGSTFGGVATFGGAAAPQQQGSSIFGGTSTSAFGGGQQSSFFGGSSANSGGGIFGGGASSTTNTSSAGGIFGGGGGANTNTSTAAGGGVFGGGSSSSSTGGVFGQPASSTPSVFGGGQQSSGGLFSGGQTSGGLFSQATTSTAAGPFGNQASSPFTSTSSGGIFGSPATTAAPSAGIFGSPATSTPASSATGVFGTPASSVAQPGQIQTVGAAQSQPSGGGLFGNSNQNAPAFNSAQPSSGDLFSKPSSEGLFTQPSAGGAAASGGLFGRPAEVTSSELDPACIYTTLQELTEDEINAFKASAFEIGKIPVHAPAKELCTLLQ